MTFSLGELLQIACHYFIKHFASGNSVQPHPPSFSKREIVYLLSVKKIENSLFIVLKKPSIFFRSTYPLRLHRTVR